MIRGRGWSTGVSDAALINYYLLPHTHSLPGIPTSGINCYSKPPTAFPSGNLIPVSAAKPKGEESISHRLTVYIMYHHISSYMNHISSYMNVTITR